ncbi:MAG: hypothetical protein ABJC89_23060, partial [Acidobacteriota bacterium]
MTKRTLYAPPEILAAGRVVLVVLGLLTWASGATAAPAGDGVQATAEHPPCGACIAMVLTTAQVSSLPERLDGLEILVRAPAGNERSAADAITAIARNGGRPGLMIEGIPLADLPAELVARTERLLIDIGSPPSGQDSAQL